MKEFRVLMFALVGLLGLMVLTSGCTQVNTGERGVVTHFGKVDTDILGEGLHFFFPIGTSVHRISVKTVLTQVETQAASKDMQVVKAHVAINWHLTPDKVADVFQKVGNEDDIERVILQPALSEVFKAETAKKTAEEILSKRAELVEMVDTNLHARVGSYGLTVDDVSVINIDFSAEFNHAIEAKQVAEQEAEKAKYHAQEAANEAQATINKARGQAESQRLLVQTLNPLLIKKAAVDKWDGHFPQVMGSSTLLMKDVNPFGNPSSEKE